MLGNEKTSVCQRKDRCGGGGGTIKVAKIIFECFIFNY